MQYLQSEIEYLKGDESRLNDIYTKILDAMSKTTIEEFLGWAMNFKEEKPGMFYITIWYEPSE